MKKCCAILNHSNILYVKMQFIQWLGKILYYLNVYYMAKSESSDATKIQKKKP